MTDMRTKDFELATPNGLVRGTVTQATSPKGVLLCLHGSPSGDLHGNVNFFDQLAEVGEPQGYTTIQFSFFGSAPSEGTAADASMRSQSEDFLAVLDYARRAYPYNLHIVGESAGATVAALNWQTNVRSYILLWPAFDLKNTDLQPYLTSEWLSVVERQGFLESDGVILGKELFKELLFKDFTPCFKIPNVSTLIVHGRSDREVPYSQSLRAVTEAVGDVTFVTVSAAGHGFKEHRKLVLDTVLEWLQMQ
jgi:pimeloyl-ACP methyl ester carboxylesterase